MAAFRAAFGDAPSLAVRAPGRVNWIGEHTDYEEGLVLPCAIDRDTIVLAAEGPGRGVSVVSEGRGLARFELGDLRCQGDWADYVKGVAWALAERGFELGGARLWIGSRVPPESGLSSSAALCVAVAFAFDRLFGLGETPRSLALAAHRGESEFVGVGCGILDPFASALGGRDGLLRIDCRDQSVRTVDPGPCDVALLVAQSGVRRRLAAGGYRERVEECRAAFAAAREAGILGPQATALRDLSPEDLPALEAILPARLLRRTRHVVTENRRVDQLIAALAAGDLAAVGDLLREGQASLRDDFEVSVPELDALCEAADAQAGTWGSRLTGAGFGGCTLHLVVPDRVEPIAEALASAFAARFGRRPAIQRVRPGAGAGDLTLPGARPC